MDRDLVENIPRKLRMIDRGEITVNMANFHLFGNDEEYSEALRIIKKERSQQSAVQSTIRRIVKKD